MAPRVLRLVAVASIFAFGLTARTVTATQAHTDDLAADPPPAVADLPPADLGEPLPTVPPATEPPATEPPPVGVEPPPADPVEPAPTDAPATDTPATDTPATDAPPTVTPPTDPPSPRSRRLPPPMRRPRANEAVPASTASPDPSPTIGDPAVSDPSAAEPVPPPPSALPSPVAVSPVEASGADQRRRPHSPSPRCIGTDRWRAGSYLPTVRLRLRSQLGRGGPPTSRAPSRRQAARWRPPGRSRPDGCRTRSADAAG